MSVKVKIEIDENRLTLRAPYDPAFPVRARELGGAWSPATRTWIFDARDEARVRDLARQVWGTDGASDDGDLADRLTIRIPVTSSLEGDKWTSEIRVAGVRLAHRPARDVPVVLAGGVVVTSGGFAPSGGSMRYPRTEALDGTMLEVRDLAPDVARRILDEAKGAHVVGDADRERETLTAERQRLADELARVDARLAELDSAAGGL